MLPVDARRRPRRDLRDRRGVMEWAFEAKPGETREIKLRLARALAQGQGGPVRRGLLKAQDLCHCVRIEGEQLLRP